MTIRAATPSHAVIVSDYAHVEGGGSQVAISSAEALAADGLAVLFFAAVGPIDPRLRRDGIRVVCLDQQDLLGDASRTRAAARAIWNGRAHAAMESELRRLDPAETVVHIHGWAKALSGSVARAAIRSGFATVVTLHDYTAVCPTGGLFDYRRQVHCNLDPLSAACIATNCNSRRYGHKLWRVARTLVHNEIGGLPRRLRHFIAVSSASRALCEPHLPAGAHVYDVANPIAVAKAGPMDVARNGAFVAIGRLSPEKGVMLFAEAARAAGVAAVFVGDGRQRTQVEACNPAARVTGWLDSDGVRRELAGARALVFPSVWREPQGMTVREAAACGVPAVVSDTCAGHAWIRDGVDGLLFRSGDADDLRRKLALLADDALTERLGRNAYDAFWADPPTPMAHAVALRQVYASMLQEASSAKGVGREAYRCVPA